MTGVEIKNTMIFSSIFASRMLGLFMIYPVLALYADSLQGATPFLMGLAMGIYGLTQAVFQLPFGWLSDYFGRKPIVLFGLTVFAIGSLVAAFSDSMMGVIIGRAIQGVGAIGSPLLAWVADSTREGVRTRAMAMIGGTIGAAFVLSLIVGPCLASMGGLALLFWFTAGLAGSGMVAVMIFTRREVPQRYLSRTDFQLQPALKGLYWNIFALHTLLSASFLVLPLKIQEVMGLSENVWKFYLPVLGLSILLVLPFLRRAEESDRQYVMMRMAIGLLGGAGFLFLNADVPWMMIVGVTGFFAAFNFLEASLPARVTCLARKEGKGFALGMYSCFQFLGLFTGGVVGGALQSTGNGLGLNMLLMILVLVSFGTLKRSKGRNESWPEALTK